MFDGLIFSLRQRTEKAVSLLEPSLCVTGQPKGQKEGFGEVSSVGIKAGAERRPVLFA